MLGQSPTNDPAKVYAKLKSADSLIVHCSRRSPIKKLAVQINDLRDFAGAGRFNTTEVTAIEIARGADKIAVKRDDKTWKLTAPDYCRTGQR